MAFSVYIYHMFNLLANQTMLYPILLPAAVALLVALESTLPATLRGLK